MMKKTYNELLKEIIEKGEDTIVEINGALYQVKKLDNYYAIFTSYGPRIFDGEHIIEPDGRVYDVNLKQEILYDLPKEKLGVEFEKPAPKINLKRLLITVFFTVNVILLAIYKLTNIIGQASFVVVSLLIINDLIVGIKKRDMQLIATFIFEVILLYLLIQ